MNARFIAIAWGTVLAGLACTAGAQTIEITSPSIGTVTVRPQPIAGAKAAAPANRSSRAETARSGVDLGIRRNPDGSLYDALDPRQNRVAANPLQYDVATAGGPPVANAADDASSAANAGNRAATAVSGGMNTPRSADFPYGVNGAVR